MKKIITMMIVMLILVGVLVSCNTNDVDTNSNIDIQPGASTNKNTDTDINTNEISTNNFDMNNNNVSSDSRDILDTLAQNDDKNLDNQDILDTLVPNDEDFPFDNIVVERSGYDIVAAGKYYGNDFDNIKYYGSYYRIIDNYEDFSELTQWGNQVDKSVFDSNVILVLHSYRSHYVYNSIRSEKGIFIELKEEKGSKKLSLTEMWIISDRAEIGKEDTIGSRTKAKSAFLYPIDVKETQYLLIPKEDLPSNLPVNGELELKSQTIVLE